MKTQPWVEMIVISNSFSVTKTLQEMNIRCLTVQDYAKQFLQDRLELFDFIGVERTNVERIQALTHIQEMGLDYESHQPAEQLETLVRKGDLVRGKYKVNRNNVNEGLVTTNFGFEIKVIGKKFNNRAILGDVVAIKLRPESEWLSKLHVEIKDDDDPEDNDQTARQSVMSVEYSSLKERILKENLCPTGEVVGIIKRDLRNLAGQISRAVLETPEVSYALVDPVDPRYPQTLLAFKKLEALRNKKIVFSVDCWPDGQAYPSGHLVGVFGDADNMDTESKVILFEHNVETRSFSQAVLNCLPPEGANYKISEAELKKRQDLRGYPIVDP